MTKLRTLLATALLTLSMFALLSSAQAATSTGLGTRLESTSATNCCIIFWNGKWYCIPC